MASQKFKVILTFLALLLTKVTSDDANIYVGRAPCPSNSSIVGYTNTTLLNEDIVTDMFNSYIGAPQDDSFTYVLCPNTIFNIEVVDSGIPGDQPITPGLSDSIFVCGDSGDRSGNCILRGGNFHFYFPDFIIAENVFLVGLTFENSMTASVFGNAHPRSHVIFFNCLWRSNTGQASVYIHHTDSAGRALEEGEAYDIDEIQKKMRQDVHSLERPDSMRNLQRDVKFSMSTVFVSCLFENNNDVMGSIFNVGGSVELVNTVFDSNNVTQLSVFSVLQNGHAYIHQDTHFENNIARLGPVFIDGTSHLQLSENNTGLKNIGDQCDAIFLEDEESFCFDRFSQCTGECCEFGDQSCDLYQSFEEIESASDASTESGTLDYVGRAPCPSNSSIIGYTNTTLLNVDVITDMEFISNGGQQASYFTYVLCPNTKFIIGSQDLPIIPGLANSVFICGENGDRNDNCTMSGGDFHFYFPDFVIAENVLILGLTFEDATLASIYGDAHPQSHVVFLDCVWKFNSGQAAIYIYHTPSPMTRRLAKEGEPYNLDEMKEIMEQDAQSLSDVKDVRDLQIIKYSMSSVFAYCSFENNNNALGTIFNLGGSVELVDTLLSGNFVAQMSIFSVVQQGHAFIHEGTRFENNVARLGPVFIDSTSSLQLSQNNSGFQNVGSQCDGIFLEDDESFCFNPEAQCTGDCCAFGDESCDLYLGPQSGSNLDTAPTNQGSEPIPTPTVVSSPNSAPVTISGPNAAPLGSPVLAPLNSPVSVPVTEPPVDSTSQSATSASSSSVSIYYGKHIAVYAGIFCVIFSFVLT